MHEDASHYDPDPAFDRDDSADLSAFVSIFPDGPDELTLRPSDARGIALMTQWVSASVETVVDLNEMR